MSRKTNKLRARLRQREEVVRGLERIILRNGREILRLKSDLDLADRMLERLRQIRIENEHIARFINYTQQWHHRELLHVLRDEKSEQDFVQFVARQILHGLKKELRLESRS